MAEASRRRHGVDGTVDLSLLTDGLRAEREQGITIDVAYRYFATPSRSFIIADTPGHELYTRNMVTGASTADLAVILVDATKGVVEQSRRHAFIASLLRVPHLVLAVNKMDLVDWEEGVYTRALEDFASFATKLDVTDLTSIPISALYGDNVVAGSSRMPWYEGPPLLYHVEHVHIASDRNLIDARLPVQWVVRPGGQEHADYRGCCGQVAGGIWRPGDDVVVLPSGAVSRVKALEVSARPVEEAYPPMAVTVRLEDDVDVSRGDMLCRPRNRPEVGRDLGAMVCWMSHFPAREGRRYAIKHTTRSGHCVLSRIVHRVDVDSLHRDDATSLALNEIGRVELRTSVPLVFDSYQRNRATGSFILIDEATNDTVAAGMILGPADAPELEPVAGGTKSANVVWQEAAVTRTERTATLSQQGSTVWLTGLPAAGKTTLAGALERRLVDLGHLVYRLDGDNLRHGLNGDLGFDPADRAENVRRTAHTARILADAGVLVLACLVSPYQADRAAARAIHEEMDIAFLEVYVATPLALCERRDPKGLYARARRGDLEGMTGIDDPYEAPRDPDLAVHPAPLRSQVTSMMALLAGRGLLEAGGG